MGKKLSNEIVARRMMANIHVREMNGTGKCKRCSSPIPKGSYSLRYESPIGFTGKMGETGICMACAAELLPNIEEIIGKISMEIEKHNGISSGEPEDESEPRGETDDNGWINVPKV